MNKVTMLLDNVSYKKNLKHAHGLSLLIEYNNKKILFDTGPNNFFLHNAEQLTIDITNLDAVVLSHSHSDHTNGLRYLDTENQIIYCGKEIDSPKYLRLLGFDKYVGIPKEVNSCSFSRILKTTQIYPNIFLMPLKSTNLTTSNLYKLTNHQKVLDDFSDELILIIKNANKLTVFTGCSHHGIINILNQVKEEFSNCLIKNVIGGFHMIGIPYLNNLGMSKKEIKSIGYKLNNFEINHFYTCHCTGLKAFDLLKPILSHKLNYLSTGDVLYY